MKIIEGRRLNIIQSSRSSNAKVQLFFRECEFLVTLVISILYNEMQGMEKNSITQPQITPEL
jgi:hypothetical protein